MIKNPLRGFLLPDDLDHEEILRISMPYIEPFVSQSVDWTPLKNRNKTYMKFDTKKFDEERDLWQFVTFMIDRDIAGLAKKAKK